MKIRAILNLGAAIILQASVAHAATDKPVEGFGKGIPLNFAVEQIVPEQFSVSYGTDVAVDSIVSWRGGADWKTVLEDMLSEKGLFADYSNTDKIRITTNAKQRAALSSGLNLAEYRQPSLKPRKDSYADDLLGDKPGLVFPDEILPELDPDEPALSAPLKPGIEVLKFSKRPELRPERLGDDAIFVGFDPEDVRVPEEVWNVLEGDSLESTLMSWAEGAGWTVVWNSKFSYPIMASAEFQGDFIGAASRLIETMSRATPPVKGEFFKGNKVLVVETILNGNG